MPDQWFSKGRYHVPWGSVGKWGTGASEPTELKKKKNREVLEVWPGKKGGGISKIKVWEPFHLIDDRVVRVGQSRLGKIFPQLSEVVDILPLLIFLTILRSYQISEPCWQKCQNIKVGNFILLRFLSKLFWSKSLRMKNKKKKNRAERSKRKKKKAVNNSVSHSPLFCDTIKNIRDLT